ncbi:uncharacterized protein ColSpa_01261 [Colletotrichum spaethianum]|uniref:Uncharacterized protein n=1 Tax=Colletotrichum spaethianum TaxID=700344 RepID=A0AA37L7W9_9PEZI|nr:uncharacterized protein ColSpa_01261 [Colletotrichum spaethianum]GKT41080.1 hypothetical protein ColSpa_01261 [Colletotrichum spaethianum]
MSMNEVEVFVPGGLGGSAGKSAQSQQSLVLECSATSADSIKAGEQSIASRKVGTLTPGTPFRVGGKDIRPTTA